MKTKLLILSISLFTHIVHGKQFDRNKELNDRAFAFMIELKKNNYERAQEILTEGINVNAKDAHGMTPLHFAINEGQVEFVTNLIKAGADINAQANKKFCFEKMGITPLDIAVGGNLTFSDSMDDYSLDNNEGNNIKNQDQIIEILLQAGADVSIPENSYLYKAVDKGNLKNVKLLIAAGANVDYEDSISPLHCAALQGKTEIVKELINAKANVNVKAFDGTTPLHKAFVYSRNIEIIEALIKAGANVNVKDQNDQTPLHIAAQSKFFDGITLLLKSGAELNATDNAGNTPCDIAVLSGHGFNNDGLTILNCFKNSGAKTQFDLDIEIPKIEQKYKDYQRHLVTYIIDGKPHRFYFEHITNRGNSQ